MKTINPDRTRCPYDVGDVLITASSAQPADRWPGTSWTQIKDVFPLAAGGNYAAGSTGGEATHVLSRNEMPNFAGTIVMHGPPSGGTPVADVGGDFTPSNTVSNKYLGGGQTAGAKSIGQININIGGGQAHNNMPPYKVFYMWQRTA